MTINVNKIKLMTNYGLAGEEVTPGILKTVYFARNGVFEARKGSWMGTCVLKASDYVLNASSTIEELEETFELNEMKYKLPIEGFAATYHFYKHVTHLNGNEAQINFYINEKDIDEIIIEETPVRIKDIPGIHYWSEKVLSYVPIQSNGGARTTTNDPIYLELRKIMKPFIETHSHNSMGAFKSGTDKANSDNEGLQLVFGKLYNSEEYDFKSWATISGNQFDDVSYEEMSKFIDLPEEIGNVAQLKKFKLPSKLLKEWLKQCEFSKPYSPSYKNYYGNRYPVYNESKADDYDTIWNDLEIGPKFNIPKECTIRDDKFDDFMPISSLISVEDVIAYEKAKQAEANKRKHNTKIDYNSRQRNTGYKLGDRISIKGRDI